VNEVAVILSAYAQSSLFERAAGVVLAREDAGHLTWTPAGIYEDLAEAHPDLYPRGDPPQVVLNELAGDEFMRYLGERRKHVFASRLPATILQEAVGRRVVELTTSEIYRRLQDPIFLAMMDIDQLRKLWKEGLSLIAPPTKKIGGAEKEPETIGGLTVDQLKAMTAALPPDQQKAVADAVSAGLIGSARVVDVEVLDES